MAKYLVNKNILFIQQYKFDDCKYKKALPFDFAILNTNEDVIGLIEYQGEQHYKPISYFGGEEKYNKQVIRDNIKKEYCKNNNIPLLSIPYWDYENIKTIIDDFISNIL